MRVFRKHTLVSVLLFGSLSLCIGSSGVGQCIRYDWVPCETGHASACQAPTYDNQGKPTCTLSWEGHDTNSWYVGSYQPADPFETGYENATVLKIVACGKLRDCKKEIVDAEGNMTCHPIASAGYTFYDFHDGRFGGSVCEEGGGSSG